MFSILITALIVRSLHGLTPLPYDCGGSYDLFDSKVIPSIQSKGYHIDKGSFEWFTNQSSYAANPSLHYTLFEFPKNTSFNFSSVTYDATNKFDDNFAAHVDPLRSTRGHMFANMTYFLYGSSGIVWYGCLPPSYYYSFKMYQNRRYNPSHPTANDSQHNNEKYPILHSFSSLGDMLNQNNINATKTGLTVIIFTPDRNTYSDIVASIKPYLAQLNLTINDMNLDIMPYQNIAIEGPGYGTGKEQKTVSIYYLKYGEDDGFMKQILSREALDSFSIMGRSGLPFENVSDSAEFMRYLKTKQRIYKVYFKQNISVSHMDKPREPFLKPYILNSSTGIYEQDTLQPYFDQYVSAIFKYFHVKHKEKYMWRYKSVKISRTGYIDNNHFGFNCIKYGTRCMADNRDCQYFVSWPDVQLLTNTSIFFMIGVSHKATNKAKWENIVPMFQNNGFEDKFYRSHYLDYLADEYINSSLLFPPNMKDSIPMDVLDKFFIVAAMRPAMCQKYFDNKIYSELNKIPKFCFSGNDYGYNESQKMFFVHRNYINPMTKTRPNGYELIPFVVMQFETQWFDFNAP